LGPEEAAAEVARAWQMLSLRLGVTVASGNDLACEVVTASARYPVFVGWEILPSLGERLRVQGVSGRAFVISDSTVGPLYRKQVGEAVTGAGYEAVMLIVPAGEESKTLKVAGWVYDWLVERRAERGDFIVALGGGVVSDLAGFVAATFARGLAFVVCPTTLLAMVDASIGGKTGVDHPKGKNLIGAFHQPRLVLADAAMLRTLPAREFRSGLAEVAKHAFILDADLLDLLEKREDALLALEPETTVEAVRRSAAIKCAVVSEDEREQGRRVVLNFGHTIGHALETATGYNMLLHGEAVSLGMVAAARISEALGLLAAEHASRVGALLSRLGLPVSLKQVEVERVLAATELDKKVRGRAVRWVLLEGFGRTVVRDDVPEDVVRQALASLKS
jgi:3-dehydroquinate synthase